ncbi:MAG: chorismate mutase [Nitrososphaerota archaeon]|jgi:chorismate mutase/prephenate dehydrogenase|uniref:chorismate mutase n=1 Tax=Candidatus Bathycorpusculum sp. TaxID=2994959 RepID=UPI00282BEA15|nr:chorismate mutase [Candidatus Termitimicrobium sp.]MCL2432278.1 chorismate mutase [Candidatus Termitimicrobium sp.]MDR0493045.1 chorismate mutase [Nitrososphaerota archaeon]
MDEIDALRKKIDVIDEQIMQTLLQRIEICRAIGELKKQQCKPIQDISRETQVFSRIKNHATQLKLDPDQIERIYREIVNMCSNVQQ